MNIKKISLFLLVLSFANNSHAESLLSYLRNILFSKELYSCSELHRETEANWKKHKNILLDPILRQNIVANSSFYIDFLNKNILKREEFGNKYRLFDYKKILWGITEIWISVVLIKLSINHKFQYMPISIFTLYNGINNTLNGSIWYQKIMEEKLTRDKKLRKHLLTSLEPLRDSTNLDLTDRRSKAQKAFNKAYRATKLILYKLKPTSWKLLLTCTSACLASGFIYKFSTGGLSFNIPKLNG